MMKRLQPWLSRNTLDLAQSIDNGDGSCCIQFASLGPMFELRLSQQDTALLSKGNNVDAEEQPEVPQGSELKSTCNDDEDEICLSEDMILADVILAVRKALHQAAANYQGQASSAHVNVDGDEDGSGLIHPISSAVVPSVLLAFLFEVLTKSSSDKSDVGDCSALIHQCITFCAQHAQVEGAVRTVRHIMSLTLSSLKLCLERKSETLDKTQKTSAFAAVSASWKSQRVELHILEDFLFSCYDQISNIADSAVYISSASSLGTDSSSRSKSEDTCADWRSTLALDDRVLCSDESGLEVIGTVVGINNIRKEITIEYTAAVLEDKLDKDLDYENLLEEHRESGHHGKGRGGLLGHETRLILPLMSGRFRSLTQFELQRNIVGGSQDQPSSSPGPMVVDFYRRYVETSGGQHYAGSLNVSRNSESMPTEETGLEEDATGARSRSNSDASNNSSMNDGPYTDIGSVPRNASSRALDKGLVKYFIQYALSSEQLLFSDKPGVSKALHELVDASFALETLCSNVRGVSSAKSAYLETFFCRAKDLFALAISASEVSRPQGRLGERKNSQHYDSRKKYDSHGYGSIYTLDVSEGLRADGLACADEAINLVSTSSSQSTSFQTFLAAAVAASTLCCHSNRAGAGSHDSAGGVTSSNVTPLNPTTPVSVSSRVSDPLNINQTGAQNAGVIDSAQYGQQPRTRLNATNNLLLIDMHAAAIETGIDLVELAEGVARVMHDIDQAVARAATAGIGIDGVGLSVRGGITVIPNTGIPDVNDGSGAIIDINGGSHSISSQQVIQAALRRRNESAMLNRLHASTIGDASRSRDARHGKSSTTSPKVPEFNVQSTTGSDLSNSAALFEKKSRLAFAVKLIDNVKRQLLMVLSDYSEELSDGCSAAMPIVDGGISNVPQTTEPPRISLSVLHAALGCLQALVRHSTGEDILDTSNSTPSCGSVVFRHIVHLFISRYGLRCRVAAETGLRAKGVHDLCTNKCVPVLNIIRSLERLEYGYTHVLGEMLVPSETLLRSKNVKEPDNKRIIRMSSIDMLDIFDKMKAVGGESGFGFLCNLIIEHPLVYSNMVGAGGTVSISAVRSDVGLKSALKAHLLLPKSEHRYNKIANVSSYYLRQLLHYLAKYASVRMLTALESIWREVIADQVEDLCNCANNSGYASSDTGYESGDTIISERGGLQMIMNGKVDILIQSLHKCREICRVDLAHKNMVCHMSADLGFMLAYKRLKKPIVLELAKALSVRVSSLLDSLKHQRGEAGDECDDDNGTHFSMCVTDDVTGRTGWVRSLELVIDLIQVLCNQTNNTEFSHFYELLLARRLLRHRFISLSLEQRVLSLLPGAMSKNGPNMIRDMKLTAANMQAFRAFVLKGIDDRCGLGDNLATFPADMMSLVFQDFKTGGVYPGGYDYRQSVSSIIEDHRGRLNIHLLSGTTWPSYWVSSIKCSNLKLPSSMVEVMNCFQRFFNIEDSKRISVNGNGSAGSSNTESESIDIKQDNFRYPLVVAGGVRSVYNANGYYEWLGNEMKDGMPVYTHVRQLSTTENSKPRFRSRSTETGKRYYLEFSSSSRCWQLKTTGVDGAEARFTKKVCVAYIAVDFPVAPDKILSLGAHDSVMPDSNSRKGAVWKVYNRHNNRWEPHHALTILKAPTFDVTSSTPASALLGPLGSSGSSEGFDQTSSSNTQRRLVWCHSAGSAVVKVNFSLDSKSGSRGVSESKMACSVTDLSCSTVYILASEPQVAVMFAFNITISSEGHRGATSTSKGEVILNAKQISKIIGLNLRETHDVLQSLLNNPTPVLQKCHSGNGLDSVSYRVSDVLLSGATVSSEEDPIVVSTTLMDSSGHSNNNSHDYESIDIVSQHAQNPWGASKCERSSGNYLHAATLRALHDWRNEVIDACIVRILKHAMVARTGEYTSHLGIAFSAVPLDLLTESVRASISSNTTRAGTGTDESNVGGSANFITVSDEDIIRRSERLVSTGVIDKISTGSKDSFRTIAYCYISSVPYVESADDTTQLRRSSSAPVGGAVDGGDLSILLSPSTASATIAAARLDAYGHRGDNVQSAPRMTGTELFNQLKLVLEINKPVEHIYCIRSAAPYVNSLSLSVFQSKFLVWLSTKLPLSNNLALHNLYSNMLRGGKDVFYYGGEEKVTDPSPKKPDSTEMRNCPVLLDELALSVLHTLAAGAAQLTALKCQHWEGIMGESVTSAGNFNERANLTVSFEPLFARIARCSQNYVGNNSFRMSSALGLSCCYFEHLPVRLMMNIAEAFCTMVNVDLKLSRFREGKIDVSDNTYGAESDIEFGDNELKAAILTQLAEEGVYFDTSHVYSGSNRSYKLPVVDMAHALHESILDALLVHAEVLTGSLFTEKGTGGVSPFPADDSSDAIDEKTCRNASLDIDVDGTTLVNFTFVDYLDAAFAAASEAEYGNSGDQWYVDEWTSDPIGSLADTIAVFFFGNTPDGIGRGIVDSLSVLYGVHFLYDDLTEGTREAGSGKISGEDFEDQLATTESESEISDEYLSNDEQEGVANDGDNGFKTNETIHEPMIPCEFCSDVFRLSELEAHSRRCGRLGLDTIDEETPPIMEPKPKSGSKKSRRVLSHDSMHDLQFDVNAADSNTRPDSISDTVISLVNSLLRVCARFGCKNTSDDSLLATISSVFASLDTDGDGYLTVSDFSGIAELSYEELRPHVDPFVLYRGGSNNSISQSKLSSFPDNNFDFLKPINSSSTLDLAALPPNFSSYNIPDALPLVKADSLWMSISNESAVLPSSSHMVRSTSLVDVAETYEDEIRRLVSKCSEVLDECESTTLALMLHYKWDCKLLVEDYVCERGHREVRSAVGLGQRSAPPFLRYDMHFCTATETTSGRVVGPRAPNGSVLSASSSDGSLDKISSFGGPKINQPIACTICGECSDCGDDFYALNCLHWFCADCWQGYLLSAVGSRNISAVCPMSKCNRMTTPAMYTYFCGDEIIEQYQSLVGQSFIEEQGRQLGQSVSRGGNTSYCKNPRGCAGVVIMADDAASSEAYCSLCGSHFCATCDLPPHAPATCELIAKWEVKGGYLETGKKEDEEARKLKHLTTKPCPKCGVRIEKSGGCPHMTCMQATCKYQFCWDCSGEYHTSSQCSRPKIAVNAGSVLAFDEQDKKCANHFLARKVALRGIRLCMSILERTLSVHTQSQALALRVRCEAWQVLSDAQSALAHSCVVMYFTPESAKLQFLYDELCASTTSMQSNLEEGKWIGLGMSRQPAGRPRPLFASVTDNTRDTTPVLSDAEVREAAAAVAVLRRRLRDYILLAATEILPTHSAKSASVSPCALTPPSARGSRRSSRRGSSPGSRSNSRPGSLPSTPLRPSPLKERSNSAGGSTPGNSAQHERTPSFGRARSISGQSVHRSLLALSSSSVRTDLSFGSVA